MDDIQEFLRQDAEAMNRAMAKLAKKNPQLPFVTLVVMANDYLTVERADMLVLSGVSILKAANEVGSFYRLKWLVDKYHAGLFDDTWLVGNFPYEWMASDPDDTDPKYLKLWKRVKKLNGGYVYDKALLPKGDLKLFRGQENESDPLGIAWTTDEEVAVRFANGAGMRTKINGVVIARTANSSDVLGFMTGRGESEVVIDPKKLRKLA